MTSKEDHKIGTKCRTGKNYVHFLKYLDEESNPAYVQMDTVVDKIGNKYIILILF